MKGIIKVVEAVIAAMILIASVTYFITPPMQEDSWTEALLKIQGEDALASLDVKGALNSFIVNNDYNGLGEELRKIIKGPVDFSIEVEGIPNSITYIACVCDNDYVEYLRKILEPSLFALDGRSVEIRIDPMNITNIDPRTDILLFLGYHDLKPYDSIIRRHLENGKSIFFITNLTQNQIEDNIFDNLFGLNYVGDTISRPEFYNIDDISTVSYKINKYFVNTPMRINTTGGGDFYIRGDKYRIGTRLNGTQNCAVYPYGGSSCYKAGDTLDIANWSVKIYNVDAIISDDEREYVELGITDKDYEFVLSSKNVGVDEKTIISDNDISAAKVNFDIINGNGRTVWFIDYDTNQTDITQLLKASILWSGGERYSFIPDLQSGITKTLPKSYSQIYYTVSNGFQPYNVILTLWYIFF